MPQFPVCANGVDALAVGAPERRPFSVTGIKAWDVLSGDASRHIDCDVQNVKLAFPELAAGDVGDAPAVRGPGHVDPVRGPKLIAHHAAIACSGIQDDESVKGLLGVRFPTFG